MLAVAPQPALPATQLPLTAILRNYAAALDDAGKARVAHFESRGTIAGAGLNGTFHTWLDGEDQRDEQRLGPRSETTIRHGDRVWVTNSDGNVRELKGVLLRRARTERFIDAGDFARAPASVTPRGVAQIAGHSTYALEVAAPGGEPQTVYLDAATWLPVRVAYDDDDGRTTIDLSDWRNVDGHRFPFKSIVSDGVHAFDTVQRVEAVTLDFVAATDPGIFRVPATTTIDMPSVETLQLTAREGHLYVPVTILGKRYEFLLDSGAQNILLDRRVAREAGLVAEGALEASGAQRTGGLQVARLAELGIGSGRLHDLVVTTLDLGQSTGGAFRIDGILGYPFFAEALVRVDPIRPSMTFGRPGSFQPSGTRVPLETDRAFPEARFALNGNVTASFIVDTGNAAELLLYRPFVEKHRGIVPFTLTGRQSFGIGGRASSYRSTLDRLDIGGYPLYHVETDVMLATSGALADRFDAGNVGLGVLKNFVFTFDLRDDALYVERGANYDDGRNRR
ncbi:MAG: aspartyl protease family protein [Candidatus Eremiobacteraeota bacterium]|nr:aspartyl protease family protein [Candidatus Eremiobacteraeota bacterium]